MDAGYYTRQVGKKGPLSKVHEKERKKRKTIRTPVWGEEDQTMPDVEAVANEISDLRSQLNRATQIIVEKDNDVKRRDKDMEKVKQILNEIRQKMRQV